VESVTKRHLLRFGAANGGGITQTPQRTRRPAVLRSGWRQHQASPQVLRYHVYGVAEL
jgi:hypothetical protein